MTTKRQTKRQPYAWIIVGAVLALAIAAALTYFIGNTTKAPADPNQQEVTLTGKVACLVHKNSDGPHTLECAIGFNATNGKTYGLRYESSDLSLSSAAGSDKEVRITGIVSDDTDQKYKTDGILKVSHFEFTK
jgi:hypothetical protein